MKQGTLYIVATPIGNLGDITYRAVETLKMVNFILCEDTRTSSALLKHYDIHTPLISFNAHSEVNKSGIAIEKILSGEKGALISDAGTPCISDPGVRLVNKARSAGIEVTGIPGANAAVLALSISGLPTDSFIFDGFLPQKKGRQKKLLEIKNEERTVVLYESVYRIQKLLKELDGYMPERNITIWRELTKKFEESWNGTPSEIMKDIEEKQVKGEFVVLIPPSTWKTD